jgi:hypothetical protein
MTIWFPFGGKQGFDNTNVCSHVGNSTLLHDVIVQYMINRLYYVNFHITPHINPRRRYYPSGPGGSMS